MKFTIIAEPKSLFLIKNIPCVVFNVVCEGMEYVDEVFKCEYPDWNIITYDGISM
jgi:hypothetical protein